MYVLLEQQHPNLPVLSSWLECPRANIQSISHDITWPSCYQIFPYPRLLMSYVHLGPQSTSYKDVLGEVTFAYYSGNDHWYETATSGQFSIYLYRGIVCIYTCGTEWTLIFWLKSLPHYAIGHRVRLMVEVIRIDRMVGWAWLGWSNEHNFNLFQRYLVTRVTRDKRREMNLQRLTLLLVLIALTYCN